MENVVLIIHLILALCLIGVVLLQRSEGGGLGIGGGGSVMTGRQAATALAKLTWVFAAGFFCTSLALTIIAARNASTTSVMDQTTNSSTSGTGPAPVSKSTLPSAKDLLPPSPTGSTGTSGTTGTPGTTSGGTSAPAAPTAPPRAGN
ncbi:preprotein translocase subunit SecG [Solirhodobacter olei]|uniref:preprotein translocase subunit SecG n=1 Tax=Solirhodobacter olei TaxID=2493082 RepID=UPI000FD8155D|nr:preprotein translocase subunit SecG [Solirhodobacter olei]